MLKKVTITLDVYYCDYCGKKLDTPRKVSWVNLPAIPTKHVCPDDANDCKLKLYIRLCELDAYKMGYK